MRKLLQHIAIFSLPLIFAILFIPIEKRSKYRELKDDCFNHGLWIHDRIQVNKKPVEIAFLGSSRTVNGINDSLLTALSKTECVNFGYCRLGRNLGYVILKEILKIKKIKKIILEVREDEDRFSHPIFPYIADSRDVLMPAIVVNHKITEDIWTHYAYKVELLQDMLYKKDVVAQIRTDDFGFSTHSDTAEATLLSKRKIMESIHKKRKNKIEYEINMKFPRTYLQRIYNLCESENVEILFLYLPIYGSKQSKPNEYKTYIQYGDLIIPPSKLLNNPNYWYDENHLNKSGSTILTTWLSNELLKQ